ncbi:MAG: acetyl-CoA carboxylase biotin carboxyl carrier protein [Pyrinomonadaceae bacterium]
MSDDNKGEGTAKKQDQSTNASLNMDELRELAELVNENGFTDFEFENENIRVRLRKTPFRSETQGHHPPQSVAFAALPQLAASEEIEPPADSESDLFKITSPIVGTYYSAAGPDKDPYVIEGSQVREDTIVCIVEAMKLMNEIQAEVSGQIVKIYVENGQPVEYGQPLFGIRK